MERAPHADNNGMCRPWSRVCSSKKAQTAKTSIQKTTYVEEPKRIKNQNLESDSYQFSGLSSIYHKQRMWEGDYKNLA